MNSDQVKIFPDRVFWDNLVDEYVKNGTLEGRTKITHTASLWDYFKYCLTTENRYFFDHPLLDSVKQKIQQKITTLPAGTTIYRARVDSKREQADLLESYRTVEILKAQQKTDHVTESGVEYLQGLIDSREKVKGYADYVAHCVDGYEGFDSKGSGAPPVEKATAGRCNPNNVVQLYASQDMHTAVAEVRPYISDIVSVATFATNRDLRLIDFYYDLKNEDDLNDWFYLAIRAEFSDVNKGNEHNYLITQYLTLLVKQLGYDGIQFKSSLVYDGLNYVIFDPSSCKSISSKLYTIPKVEYTLLPVWVKSHLLDADGNIVPDPKISLD